MRTTNIGVVPGSALGERPRLFRALEAALPVRFEARSPGAVAGLAAVLVLDGDPAGAGRGVPALITQAAPAVPGPARRVRFAAGTRALDPRLHGQVLTEADGCGELLPEGGDEVLASADGSPVWLRRGAGGTELAAVIPAELGPDEPLRARLRAGRFLGLLPLLHFLRRVAAAGWTPPPPRACVIFDDPNLHWPSYGHLDFRALDRHAAEWGYHVALATVPIDGWFAHPSALRLVKRTGARLSLTVHGNNHERFELARPAPEARLLAMLAQADRRAALFERRTGVPVDRVMVPPHGACAEATVRALARTRFDAITANAPFPWHADPVTGQALAGWHPAERVTGGLPVLLRQHLSHERQELLFRALLDQPIVLYGHHDDVAGGLDELAAVATQVNRLGPVRWCSLGEIGRTSYAVRRDGDTLHVRPYARALRVRVPDGVRWLAVEGGPAAPRGVTGPADVDVELPNPVAMAMETVRSPGWRPWPMVRRTLSEARDRARPLITLPEPAIDLATPEEPAPAVPEPSRVVR